MDILLLVAQKDAVLILILTHFLVFPSKEIFQWFRGLKTKELSLKKKKKVTSLLSNEMNVETALNYLCDKEGHFIKIQSISTRQAQQAASSREDTSPLNAGKSWLRPNILDIIITDLSVSKRDSVEIKRRSDVKMDFSASFFAVW